MQQTLQLLHEIVWGPWTMLLFLGTGLFFTVKSGGFQIRKLPYWWKKTMGSLGNGSVSSFQTSLDFVTLYPFFSFLAMSRVFLSFTSRGKCGILRSNIYRITDKKVNG